MDLTRREFVKAVAAAVVPVASGSSPAFTVHRSNMWAPDADSTRTLTRCDRVLMKNPDDVLALCHRGQVSPFLRPKALAEVDLNRAVSLEPSPAMCYIRGVVLERADNLEHAILLLTRYTDIGGKAICTSQPDIYHWHGSDDGELLYLSFRELGSVLEGQGRIEEAPAAFERAASFRVISQADLERWCEADMQVGRLCEAVIGYTKLVEIEDKAEYRQRLVECQRCLRMPRSEWWSSKS